MRVNPPKATTMAAARPLLPSSKVVASPFTTTEDNTVVEGPPLTHKMPTITHKMSTKSHKSSPGRQQRKNPSYRHNNNTKKKLCCNTPSSKSHSPSSLTKDNNIFKKIVCNINKSVDNDQLTKITKIKRTDNNRDIHKITRIDLDEVSVSSSCMTADEDIPSSKGRKKKNVSRSYHSAPSNLKDYPGRLLTQMGMDVTNDDYCIEGEYEVSKRNKGSRHRSHSLDCNYNTPIDDKYEDFGIERKLIESKTHKHSNHSRVKKQVRTNTGTSKSDDNRKDDQQVYGSSSLLKAKVMSILRGGISSTTKPNKAQGEIIPGLIMASFITPTTSEDEMECPLTPEETHLFLAWQHARFRHTTKVVVAPSLKATTRVNKKNYEDVLSIASSSGDKTIPMDNRKRQLRQGFSF